MADPEIQVSRRGASGHILLDRPAALNAITLTMVRAIAAALDEWEHDPAVRCVVVEAAGERAFSAGGDIRQLYEQGRAGDHDAQLAFWREEYILNCRIKAYPKPYVALIDGIVMGGGVGVSLHGSHRIAGDRFDLRHAGSRASASFPMSARPISCRDCPAPHGTYLALTGARIEDGDAVALGLADAYVPSAHLKGVAPALAKRRRRARFSRGFEQTPPAAALTEHRAADRPLLRARRRCRDFARLDADSRRFRESRREDDARKIADEPRASRCGRCRWAGGLDMEEAMRTEFRIVSRLCRGNGFPRRHPRDDHRQGHDARAGVPPRSTKSPRPTIDAYFAPLGDSELIPARRAA